MFVCLVLLVFRAMAVVHAYLARYAPSNVVAARVRAAPPRWRIAGGLWALAWLLAALTHLLSSAIVAGAPGSLNLVVLVTAWDAFKFGVLGWLVVLRWLAAAIRGLGRRRQPTPPTPSQVGAGPAWPPAGPPVVGR